MPQNELVRFTGVGVFVAATHFAATVVAWNWLFENPDITASFVKETVPRFFAFPLHVKNEAPDLSWSGIPRSLFNSAIFGTWIALACWFASLIQFSRWLTVLSGLGAWLLFIFIYAEGVLPLSEYDNSLVGIFGTMITIFGFAFTIVQLIDTKKIARQAQSSAVAAKEAAEQTAREHRTQYRAFGIQHAQRLFGLAVKYVEQKKWSAGGDFLGLVSDELTHVANQGGDPGGQQELLALAVSLRGISHDASLVETKRLKQADFLATWTKILLEFWALTNKHTGPLPQQQEE